MRVIVCALKCSKLIFFKPDHDNQLTDFENKKYHACFLFKQTFCRVKKLSITMLPFVCHNQNNSCLSQYVTGKNHLGALWIFKTRAMSDSHKMIKQSVKVNFKYFPNFYGTFNSLHMKSLTRRERHWASPLFIWMIQIDDSERIVLKTLCIWYFHAIPKRKS